MEEDLKSFPFYLLELRITASLISTLIVVPLHQTPDIVLAISSNLEKGIL